VKLKPAVQIRRRIAEVGRGAWGNEIRL